MRRPALYLAGLGVMLAVGVPTMLVSAPRASAEAAKPAAQIPFWATPGQPTEPQLTPMPSVSPDVLPMVTQAEVIGRAQTWLHAKHGGGVPYSMSRTFQGYRTDCSGYVSLAFGWAMPGYVTSEMAQRSVTTPITKDQLVQADLLINPGIGPAGHAVIFDHWADPAHTSYWGYEQSGDGGTHYRQIPYPYFDGYPMSPYRYNRLIIGPVTHPNGDYDGDGKTDQALFRPADGTWYIRHSSDQSVEVLHWGQKGDIPVPGDYDGDHRTDEALYRNGMWYIRNSSNGSVTVLPWGTGGDIPVPADYDGDGRADPGLYRSSTSTWYVRRSSNSTVMTVVWGQPGDIPVPGDYDGDDRADEALYRPSSSAWYVRNSSDPSRIAPEVWGVTGDLPIQADYDGDGKTDQALYRPSTGTWYARYSASHTASMLGWGTSSDLPVPGDYDGDGKTDQALYRPPMGTWYTRYSSNFATSTLGWGLNGDVPTV